MNTTKPTPGPLILIAAPNRNVIDITNAERNENGFCPIASVETGFDEPFESEQKNGAAFIVEACNAYDSLRSQNEALVEALRNLLVMLPSTDHMDAGTAGIKDRIPAGFCYVRWLDILEARAALELARGKV